MFLSIVDSVVAPSPWPAVTAVPPDREWSQYHGLGDAATAAWWYSLVTNLLLLSSQSLVLSGQSLLNLPGSLSLLLQLLLYLCDVVAMHHYYYTNSIVSHREGTINATPPPADVSHLDPLQYSSILTVSAGTLSCLPRLLPLISYPPPTARHLPAGLYGREELLCLQYTCTTAQCLSL